MRAFVEVLKRASGRWLAGAVTNCSLNVLQVARSNLIWMMLIRISVMNSYARSLTVNVVVCIMMIFRGKERSHDSVKCVFIEIWHL